MNNDKLTCVIMNGVNIIKRKKEHIDFDKEFLILDNHEHIRILDITSGIEYREGEFKQIALTEKSKVMPFFDLNHNAIDFNIPKISKVVFYKFCSLFNGFNNKLLDINFFIELSLIDGNKIYIDCINHNIIDTHDLIIKSYKFSEIDTIYEKGKCLFYNNFKFNIITHIVIKYKFYLYYREVNKLISSSN